MVNVFSWIYIYRVDPHWIKNIWGIQQFTTTILGIWFCLKIGYPQIHHCHQSLYTCIDKTYTWVALADLKCSALFSCLSIKQPSIHSWKKTCYCLRPSILWPFFAAQMAGDRTGLFWRLIAWVIMIHIITIAVHYSLIILIITRELSWLLSFYRPHHYHHSCHYFIKEPWATPNRATSKSCYPVTKIIKITKTKQKTIQKNSKLKIRKKTNHQSNNFKAISKTNKLKTKNKDKELFIRLYIYN